MGSLVASSAMAFGVYAGRTLPLAFGLPPRFAGMSPMNMTCRWWRVSIFQSLGKTACACLLLLASVCFKRSRSQALVNLGRYCERRTQTNQLPTWALLPQSPCTEPYHRPMSTDSTARGHDTLALPD